MIPHAPRTAPGQQLALLPRPALVPGGPAPGRTLASCYSGGCCHRECARAFATQERCTGHVAHPSATRRRLRALARNGWSPASIAAQLPIPEWRVRRILLSLDERVSHLVASAARQLYDRLWDKPGGCEITARFAQVHHWPAALAWDDDNSAGRGIDDPTARPVPRWARTRRLTRAELAAELAELAALCQDRNEAARRMGVTRNTFDQIITRVRRAGHPVPWASQPRRQAPAGRELDLAVAS